MKPQSDEFIKYYNEIIKKFDSIVYGIRSYWNAVKEKYPQNNGYRELLKDVIKTSFRRLCEEGVINSFHVLDEKKFIDECYIYISIFLHQTEV